MAEHVCKWYFNKDVGMYKCEHPKCRKGLGLFVVADRLNKYETLTAEDDALLDAANSLLGLIDCLGGGFSLDDAGPDRKTLAKLADYPNHMNKKLALLTREENRDGETDAV